MKTLPELDAYLRQFLTKLGGDPVLAGIIVAAELDALKSDVNTRLQQLTSKEDQP